MNNLKIEVFKKINYQGRLIAPKELKNMGSFFSFRLQHNRGKICVFVDNQKNLWYKDFQPSDKSDKSYKGFIKISGLCERKNTFLLDLLSKKERVRPLL